MKISQDSPKWFPAGMMVGVLITWAVLSWVYHIPVFAKDAPPPKYKCELVEYR